MYVLEMWVMRVAVDEAGALLISEGSMLGAGTNISVVEGMLEIRTARRPQATELATSQGVQQ